MQTLSGFLLTRHWRDSAQGVELIFWAHSPEAPLRLLFPDQRAVCFIATDTALDSNVLPGLGFERKPLTLRALDGHEVDGLYFRHQRDLQRLREHANRSDIPFYESDIKPHDRFLMERFITAPFELRGEPVQKPGYLEFVNPSVRPAAFKPELSYVSLDIETDGSDGKILSMAMRHPGGEVIFMQGKAADWDTELPIRWFEDEQRLLIGFFDAFKTLDPDLILGWNLINFDLDYIERRCRHNRLPFALGRGADKATILQPQQSGQARFASLPGRVALDGIDTLKSAFWRFDSFELGNVATQLLGRKKLIEIIAELWQKRENAKQSHNRHFAQAIKIIMNAFYGVLGATGRRFYDPRLASSITRRGHKIITRSRDQIEAQGFRVIYGDTDSLFVWLGPEYDEARAQERGKALAASLNRWWSQTFGDTATLTGYTVGSRHHAGH